MSMANNSKAGSSESVRISKGIKVRLEEYCRERKQPLRCTLDKAIYAYVQERLEKELH